MAFTNSLFSSFNSSSNSTHRFRFLPSNFSRLIHLNFSGNFPPISRNFSQQRLLHARKQKPGTFYMLPVIVQMQLVQPIEVRKKRKRKRERKSEEERRQRKYAMMISL
ncbi:uncharacterized protein LOC116130916 [Pistacia vera]|uniref:uncharacterized protein LOC116130916 n=1 Tax=Pistacia vera TaxID=55513 RepID=UPI001262EC38|nr:uncharacterized protein LOC116130916 [Pistacia vera]